VSDIAEEVGVSVYMQACGLMRQGLIEEHEAEGRSLSASADLGDQEPR
jgi:hypothetical protein